MAPAILTPSGVLAELRLRGAAAQLRSGEVSARALASVSRSGTFDTNGTYADQLLARADQVRAVLEQYTRIAPYDEGNVNAALAAFAGWQDAHKSTWDAIKDRVLGIDSTLSPSEALQVPVPIMRAYVEGLFLSAAYAVNMYTNGVFGRLVSDGEMSTAEVRDDAEARMQCFDTVLALEQAGTLAQIYGTAPLAGAFGLGVVQVEIVIAVVAAIAVVIGGVMYFRQTTLNNKIKNAKCQQYLTTLDPRLNGACDAEPTDAVQVAKYAIGVAAAGLFLYYFVPQVPALLKGFKT